MRTLWNLPRKTRSLCAPPHSRQRGSLFQFSSQSTARKDWGPGLLLDSYSPAVWGTVDLSATFPRFLFPPAFTTSATFCVLPQTAVI